MVEVIAIFGPTAAGKTAIAEAVADRAGTDVVSADALQVYRGLPILTNQPTRLTRLVAIRGVHESMSVGEYAPLAHAAIDELVAVKGLAVVAGGSGLYLRAALADLSVPPAVDDVVRARVEAEVTADPQAAHRRLALVDAAAAEVVHPNDRRRLVRALELADVGASLVPSTDRLWTDEARRPSIVVGIDVPADVLEARIEARAESMFVAGVVDEVRRVVAGDVSKTAEMALGLREIASLPPEEARRRLVERTRRYAAYQRKWMRRIPGLILVDGRLEPREAATLIVGRAAAAPR